MGKETFERNIDWIDKKLEQLKQTNKEELYNEDIRVLQSIKKDYYLYRNNSLYYEEENKKLKNEDSWSKYPESGH